MGVIKMKNKFKLVLKICLSVLLISLITSCTNTVSFYDDLPDNDDGRQVSNDYKTLPVKWEMPVLDNPIIIDLDKGDNPSRKIRERGRDVLILGKTTGIYDGQIHLQSGGPHDYALGDCVVLGGKYTGRVALRDFGGTVYIEGVHIDVGGDEEDAFVASGNRNEHNPAHVILQNCIAEGIQGHKDRTHGDMYQPQGIVESLRVYNFTGYSGYQGFMIDDRNMEGSYIDPDIGVIMEKMSLRYQNHHSHASCLLFFDPSQERPFPITLIDCNIDYKIVPGPGRNSGELVGNRWIWHDNFNFQGDGYVTRVDKDHPVFVKRDEIGVNYYHTIRLEAEECDSNSGVEVEQNGITNISDNDWIKFTNVYLGARGYQFRVYYHNENESSQGSRIELRSGSTTGPMLAAVTTASNITGEIRTADFQADIDGTQDLYICFDKGAGSGENIGNIDWIEIIIR